MAHSTSNVTATACRDRGWCASRYRLGMIGARRRIVTRYPVRRRSTWRPRMGVLPNRRGLMPERTRSTGA